MPNVLEVQIVGDVSALEKSLNEAKKLQADYTASIEKTSSELKESISVANGYKKAIEDLNKEYKNGAISSKDYSKQLANLKRDEKEAGVATKDLQKELANLKREQKDLGGSFGSLSKRTVDGSNALTQFSRIAQDAPFGIMGIGNNITATVEAFGNLQKSTGSTGSALKAMASSILGSGGILLAVSLVTTALTYMSQNGITVGDVFKKLTGTFDKARQAAQELNVEAVKGSQEQISTMNAYVAVASNVNLSMSDRLVAVKKLQSEYPAYFGNLTQEQILNGNVATAIRGATQALIAKAKAAASVEKVVQLAEEEEKLQNEINNAIAQTAKQYKLTKKEAFDYAVVMNKQLRGQIDLLGELEKGNAKNLSSAERTALATVRTVPGFNDARKALMSLRDEQDKYTDSVNKNIAAQIKLETSVPKTGKKEKQTVRPKIEAIPELTIAKSTDDQNDKILADFRDILSEDLTKLKTEPIKLNIPLQAVASGSEFEAYAAKLKQAKEDTQIFADASGAAVNALAGDLASSLATGNAALDAFVGSVIQGLAEVAAAQLAGLIAKSAVTGVSLTLDAAQSTGNAITAATETAAATGPAAAFVLPALVGAAIGFIAAAFSGIKFAHGGIVPGGSFTGDKIPAMLNSGEAVMNQQQQANTLMAIANGNSNALQSNRKSSTFVLETKLRGKDLLLAIKREESSR